VLPSQYDYKEYWESERHRKELRKDMTQYGQELME